MLRADSSLSGASILLSAAETVETAEAQRQLAEHPGKPALRFTLNDRVECYMAADTWAAGKITKLWYTEDGWDSSVPPGWCKEEDEWDGSVPYQVRLNNGTLIFVPFDENSLVRRLERESSPTSVVSMRSSKFSPRRPDCTPPPETALLPDAVFEAARRGEQKKVIKWLRKGSVDARRADTGDTLLHAAVVHRHPDLMRELVKKGATIDAQNTDGGTPLIMASQLGARHEAELLLQHSADVNLQTPADGATALMVAAAHSQPETLSLLLAAKAALDVQTTAGYTALMSAAGAGADRCVQLLLDAGARTELTDNTGCTALGCAQSKRQPSTQRLLQRAAKPREPPRRALALASDSSAPPTKQADCRLQLPERSMPQAACTDARRRSRSLHRATGLLARAIRDD